MKYEVRVANNVMMITDNKELAEKRLNELKDSFLALVHCSDSFYIKTVE